MNFANIGGDFDPVSGPDGLLGPEFEAQLQLADGTNLQDPASFLESPIFSGGSHGSTGPSGIFSGGSRSIPGYSGGAEVELQVAIRRKEAPLPDEAGYILLSNVITVRLGNEGNPPSTPSSLRGLEFPPALKGDSYASSAIPDSLLASIAMRNQRNLEHLNLRLLSRARSGMKKILSVREDFSEGPIQTLEGIEQFVDLDDLRLTGEANPEELGRPLIAAQTSLAPIESLSQLETLDLSGNQLIITSTQLDTLFRLPSLITLNLDYAKLDPVLDLRNLPSGLKELSLRGCQIESIIFPEQANDTLESINLDANHIEVLSIPDHFSRLVNVGLIGNPLTKIRATDYRVIDTDAGIIVPSSFVIRDGKPRFTAHSQREVSIQRSSDLITWIELGRKEFRRLNAFIGSTQYTDESYQGGPAFYRLRPID
ncbi:protein phosphatase 1 regulatory subunit 42 [Verrucomicrobia bacterium]|nr:protein phosphatase 1 regulatory subunit 42 [Verrucomicrobiota bacterium]